MTNSQIKAKHQPHTITFSHIMQKSEYKANGLGFTVVEKMAANNPLVEIGSRGTVGSLVLQEIEYFSRLQLNHHNSTQKPRQVSELASTNSHSRPKLGSLVTNPKKKRRRCKLMPSMCSMVEVAECNPPTVISRFTYRNLKADI
ncbi:PREDICTED: uncharacterized protein LOC109230798 [Nicotiana attenuata]|uniref:uncharacterized protein LOC109230798 n=1 Tax=Nicotiana attenuata TaxID=49451 RepID=UPI0009047A52|nr:PREDICTED: uncharacterized protein LOC109230798 [Nicotiana attenuata]